MSKFWKISGSVFLTLMIIIPCYPESTDFASWSADLTHPYFSAWHPGFSSRLTGTNPDTAVYGWRQYDITGISVLDVINCLTVHYTDSTGQNYIFYIAQDTKGNIRYLQEGDTSFLDTLPIFFPASTSNNVSWTIPYLMGQHRFQIFSHNTYQKNSYNLGPYDNSLFMRHYWDEALMGQIVTAPRIGYVQYDGQDISTLQEPALGKLQGVVTDAWSNALLSDASILLEGGAPRRATSDTNGFYSIIDIPQSTYSLTVQKALYRDYKSDITTPLSTTMEFNIELIPLSGSISGTITDNRTGSPIAGANIQLDGLDATRIQTDTSGFYRFQNVRIGSHQVQTWGAIYKFAEKTADVTTDQETTINFQLEMLNGAITGVIRNSLSGVPVVGAPVQIDGLDATRVTTSADGSFTLENVVPGYHDVQTWQDGYFFLQIRVNVQPNQTLDMGNVYLAPTSSILPEGTNFYFDDGAGGWTLKSFPGVFGVPLSTSSNGHLGLSPGGNTNCFGYWESPFIAFTPGKTYRIRFTLTSNLDDPQRLPNARLRINSGNNQIISFLSIDSRGSGESSPTTTPKTYDVIFLPPISSSSYGFTICFDLINIGTDDDATAWIYLESVETTAVNITETQ